MIIRLLKIIRAFSGVGVLLWTMIGLPLAGFVHGAVGYGAPFEEHPVVRAWLRVEIALVTAFALSALLVWLSGRRRGEGP